MTSGETEFQFELNETLYFDDGYHVQELISIAVDPEITIHPYDTYVSIRGKIELQGEYIKEQEKPTEEEFTLDLEDFQAKRLIEKVSANENNHMEFSHRFPVEISIPSYRIQGIDDIHVEIVNFDYEFPTSNQLNLTALAVIHGMKEEFDLLEGKRKSLAESELEVPELPTFEFEIKKRETDEEKEEIIQNSVDEIILSKMNEEQRTDEELKLDLQQPNERIEEELRANQQEEKLIYKEEKRKKVEETKETVIEVEADKDEEDETKIGRAHV